MKVITGRGPDRGKRSGALRDIAALWGGLNHSPGKARLLLLGTLVALIVGLNTFGQIRLNSWQGAFYDAIGRRDFGGFVHELGVFAIIVGSLLILVVAQTWLSELIKVRLRGILTQGLLDVWLAPRRAYLLQFAGEVGENPDQRVHEDVRHLSELATDLGIGLLQSTLLLASFVGVLWVLSWGMALWIDGRLVVVPGYMVWCALAYSLAGSWLTWVVGRPLIRLNIERYAREAAFRFSLVKIDEAAQSIALYGGEQEERVAASALFDAVQVIGRKLANAVARLTWVTSSYGWGTLVVPVIAASPAYFSGSLSLGGLMMVIGAFGQVQQALRWFVDNFSRIADWRATLRRVVAIRETLAGLDQTGSGPRISVEESPDGTLAIEELRLDLPAGSAVLEGTPATVAPGEHVLVVGQPGAGKSTLFLALAGLWTAGSGRLLMPPRSQSMFLPQRPYLPQGTLRRAITASVAGPSSDDEITAVLGCLGLGHLARDLDRTGRWDRDLPLDEQQGLALARALLQKPAWVFMDNPVSAFDEPRRKALLAVLRRELPHTSFMGTSRFEQLNGFWTRTLHLRRTNARA